MVMEAKERKIRESAQKKLATAVRGRPLLGLLTRGALFMARRSIRHRESSRLDRARAFGMVPANLPQTGAAPQQQRANRQYVHHPLQL